MHSPTLRVAVPALPTSLDPATLLDPGASLGLAGNAYGPFVGPPGTASAIWEAIEPDEEYRTFTVRVALGVRSAAGELLAADDVVWSWSRAFALGGAPEAAARAAGLDGFESVDYVNRQTVRFRLRAPNRAFEQLLLEGIVPLIDSKTARRQATTEDLWARDWLACHTAGFGAYHVDAFTPGQSLDLRAVPGVGVAFDEVIVQAVEQSDERTHGLLADEFDLALFEPAAGSQPSALRHWEILVPAIPGTDGASTTVLALGRDHLAGLEGSPLAGIVLAALLPAENVEG